VSPAEHLGKGLNRFLENDDLDQGPHFAFELVPDIDAEGILRAFANIAAKHRTDCRIGDPQFGDIPDCHEAHAWMVRTRPIDCAAIVDIEPRRLSRILPDRVQEVEMGLDRLIGKGGMGAKTQKACQENGCVYLHAIGGAAQIYAQCVQRVLSVRLEQFGSPEAVWELEVRNFPVVVTIDSHGIIWQKGQGETKKVLIAGGTPITLCRYTGNPRGASWGVDDTIILRQAT